MARSNTKDEFLQKNRISDDVWLASGCDWSELDAIAADHVANTQHLGLVVPMIANLIQSIESVHSVRWRIKETDHLLEKIVRKRAQREEKYLGISRSNYHTVVTDLVGIRALHLFKDDCFDIDTAIRANWEPVETPVAYVREGDPQALLDRLKGAGFHVKDHPAAYRSVHYVCETTPTQRKVNFEIQVRTIFEEGWSEIDHRVRYPNFSDAPLVSYFLTIFNRMSGAADEMGSFVRDLASTLGEASTRIEAANRERDMTFASMDQALKDLEAAKKQDEHSKSIVQNLKTEIEKLKQSQPNNRVFFSPTAKLASDGLSVFANRNAAKVPTSNEFNELLRTIRGMANTEMLESVVKPQEEASGNLQETARKVLAVSPTPVQPTKGK